MWCVANPIQHSIDVFLGNFLGLPSCSCPIAFDETNDDMPVGMLFTGKQWSDSKMFLMAKSVQQILGPLQLPSKGISLF